MTHEELKAIQERVYKNYENGTAAKGFLGFHERAARVYEEHGKIEDAEAAREMADRVRGL